MEKFCNKCKTNKQATEFYPNKAQKSGRASWCRSCAENYLEAWRLKNKDRYRECLRDYHLRKKFGITTKEYDNLLKQQNNSCAICKKQNSNTRQKYFHVDHCHSTGKVRGLLCSKCNHMIGLSGDNQKVLQSAIEYLGKEIK